MSWRRHPEWRHGPPPRGRLFLRFLSVFGLFAVLLMGGLALLIFLVVRLAGGDRQTAAVLWLSTCGLLLLLPLAVLWMGRFAFRGFAVPLADLMTAADAVATGDLTARVNVSGRGEFRRLGASFNRMVEELARADQQRRNLTADVAHELRTPLQIIQGNLEGVLDGVYAPTAEHIAATLDETRMLARLVEDLRTLSLAENGQLPMHWEDVDVVELVTDAATSFSGQAQVARVQLTTTIDPEVVGRTVPGDYDRLDQALSNLLANALRHTPPGGAVTLSASATPDGVCIQVRDSGEGIVPEDLPFVFDRFWRGDRTRPRDLGSGLGLAITRQLVRAHHGQLSVQSTPGHGSVFTMELPLQHTAHAGAPPSPDPSSER